jgi:hypothetical protein
MIRLNDKWAVGFIAEPPQWTLCRLKISKHGEEWRPVSWCQTKHALLTAVHEKIERGASFYPGSENLAVDADGRARIADFPDMARDWSNENV